MLAGRGCRVAWRCAYQRVPIYPAVNGSLPCSRRIFSSSSLLRRRGSHRVLRTRHLSHPHGGAASPSRPSSTSTPLPNRLYNVLKAGGVAAIPASVKLDYDRWVDEIGAKLVDKMKLEFADEFDALRFTADSLAEVEKSTHFASPADEENASARTMVDWLMALHFYAEDNDPVVSERRRRILRRVPRVQFSAQQKTRLERYLRVAECAYHPERFIHSLGVRVEEHAVASYDAEHLRPAYFLFCNEEDEEIVVAVRGTFSIADGMTDIAANAVEFGDGYVHSGMLASAQSVLNDILPHLEKMSADHPQYTLTLVGHSLGAGVAALLVHMIARTAPRAIPPRGDVQAICFAPPALVSTELVESPINEKILSFVHNDDIVPRASLASMQLLLLQLIDVDWQQRASDKHDEFWDSVGEEMARARIELEDKALAIASHMAKKSQELSHAMKHFTADDTPHADGVNSDVGDGVHPAIDEDAGAGSGPSAWLGDVRSATDKWTLSMRLAATKVIDRIGDGLGDACESVGAVLEDVQHRVRRGSDAAQLLASDVVEEAREAHHKHAIDRTRRAAMAMPAVRLMPPGRVLLMLRPPPPRTSAVGGVEHQQQQHEAEDGATVGPRPMVECVARRNGDFQEIVVSPRALADHSLKEYSAALLEVLNIHHEAGQRTVDDEHASRSG